MSALADHGIRLRRGQPGEHRCPCPRCAEAKPRRGDDALAVKLEPDGGATWVCHRCGWSGGLPPPREAWRPARRPASPKPEAPDPKAERNRELAQAIWRETVSLCACADGGRAWRYL